MRIVLNGRDTDLPEPMTIAQLVAHVGITSHMLIAEHNGRVLPKDRWTAVTVAEGDAVELVQLMGGGR